LTFLLVRGLRRGLTVPLGIAIGAMLVVTPIMKGTAYALYPAAALALAGMLWRRRGRRELPAYGALAAAVVGLQAVWSGIADSFGRSTFTTPGGVSPVATGGTVTNVLDQPTHFLSYLWQVFLPRLPFMVDLHVPRWPAFDIYVERGWAAFGWYAIQFPTWVYVVIVGVMLVVGALCAVSVWRERAAARARGLELAVLVVVVAGVVAGVEAAYLTSVPRSVVAEQGRYAFTAIIPLATIALGACFAFGRRRAATFATVLVVAVIGLSYASQVLTLTRFFA